MFSQILNTSNYYFNPYAIPGMLVGTLIILIGFFVLSQNKKSSINIAFFFQCFSVGIWVFTISFVYLSRMPDIALLWYRHLTFLGVVNIMPSFCFLAIAWAGELDRKKLFVISNYLISFLCYYLAIATSHIIDPHNIRHYFWGFYPIYKPWALVFILIYTAQFISGVYIFYRAYKNEKISTKRAQIKTIIVATLIASAASFDFVPKFLRVPFYPYGYIPIFIYVTLVAYSIVRYKTFDIETAIHKTGMWLLSFSFIIIPMVILYRWIMSYIKEDSVWQIIFWTVTFLILAFYLRAIQPKIDYFFQRKRSNLEEISSRFTEDLVHLKGINQLIQHIENAITDAIYPQEINIFIYNDITKCCRLANSKKDVPLCQDLKPDDKFLQQLAKNNKIAHKEFVEIDPAYASIKDAAKDYFRRTGAIVVIPLVLNENLLGIINLSRKTNFKRYSGPDFHFLTTLKNQATIAISNSLLYENMEAEVRQRTKELVDVQKQLIHAEKLATVGTLAGGVAHEINNPLTAILTNVQMLLASDTIDDKLDKESLELIEEATKRCRTIVQKLMTYARKPLETTEVKKIDLMDVLKAVLSFIGYQLDQENVKIVTHAPEDAYFVVGNQNELEQVFTNFILNAKDAIKKINKTGAIEITFSKDKNWIKVDIKDEGAGIPKEIVSKIFDPFFTTKDVGKGVGLGLSICQAIVEKHNGKITFKSEPKKGSVFSIQFPEVDAGVRYGRTI